MKNHSGISIILGHKNLGETDKLIFLYSKDLGKIKVIAKGARRITSKFTGHLETLNICKTQIYFGPSNIILTEIETLKTHKKIREDLQKTNCALKLINITNKLIYENQKPEGLHNLLTKTLESINKNENLQTVSTYYIIQLLNKIGVMPDLKKTTPSKIKNIIDEVLRSQTNF